MKLKTMVLASLVGSSLLAGVGTFKAAEEENQVTGSEDGKGATSHGYIKLSPGDEDTGATAPTDPTDPTDPSGETGNEGILTIDHIAILLFGQHKLTGQAQTYTSTVDRANVQVTDKRGTEEGWTVQVSQTKFVDKVDNTKILKGTELALPAGTLKDSGNVSIAPELNPIVINDTPTTFMKANKGSGAGTWTTIFEKNDITLKVPAGNKTGEYMSDVTWSLLDAPL